MAITGDFEAYLTDDWHDGPITVPALLECEDEGGFEYVVVMPQPKEVPDNDGLLARAAGHPRLLPCVMMDPHRGDAALVDMERWAKAGARGIKLMGVFQNFEVDDPIVFPVAERAAELGLIVSIHSGVDNCRAYRIGTIAGKIPDTPVIMDHMGMPDNFDEGMAVCREHANVYMGTTILRFHKQWASNPEESIPVVVRQAVEELGPERVVFGSNLPEYRPIQVRRAIERLGLGEEAEGLIFGGNLARIYGLG